MAVEVLVLGQAPGVIGQAGGQQVRDDAGHRRRTQHFLEAAQATPNKQAVDVVKEVVDVLHRHLEVDGA